MDAVLAKVAGANSRVELLCVLAELQKLMAGADGLEVARAATLTGHVLHASREQVGGAYQFVIGSHPSLSSYYY